MNLFTFAKRLPLSVVLALLILSATTAHAQQRQPDCYVLSAGIDNYQSVGDLKGCISDARNTSSAFSQQQGKLFGSVHTQTLTDREATQTQLLQQMQALARKGSSGDFVVIFLSGHGGRTPDNKAWYFLPQDYSAQQHARTALTDRQILDAADVLVMQGKKVFVIVDACHAGQLAESARGYMSKYRNAQAGGLVLMLSSSADQLSNALGQYSAFAKAFADSMAGGDLNNDGRITLGEIRRFSFDRTHKLIRDHGMNAKQDSEVAWSPSMSEHTPLALTRRTETPVVNQPQVPAKTHRIWTGSESLQGYGQLTFQIHQGGRVVMQDTAGVTEGTWQQNGSQATLQFSNGRVVYSGTVQGNVFTGTARNERTSWTFDVRMAN